MAKKQKPSENGKKEFSMWNNLAYILRQAWECDKGLYFYMGMFTIMTAIQPFIGIFAPKLLIDEFTGQRRPWVFVVILGGLLIVSMTVSFLIDYCMGRYRPKQQYLIYYLRGKLDEKVMKMKFEHTEDPDSMDRLSESRESIMSWGEGMVSAINEIARASGRVLSFVGYAWIIFTLHPLILLLILVNVALVYYFNDKAKKKEIALLPIIGNLNRKAGYIEDAMANFEYGKDSRLYHMGDWLTGKAWFYKKDRIKKYYDLQRARFLPNKVNGIFLLFRQGIIYAYLIFKFVRENMGVGDFMMYFTTVNGVTDLMQQILSSVVELKGQSAYANIYRNYLDIEDEQQTPNPKPIPEAHTYDIEFDHVKFRYPHGKTDIYRDLCLKIPAGQKLAIVGINGAGKTSFVKLLSRLYDPQEGTIRVGGVDIKEFDREEYWTLFSTVFQEIKMFAFPVAENVALSPDYDREKVQNAVDLAGMGDKVASLRHGLDTSVLKILDDEGIEFSGGENQKLALARALYKDGPIIVLDEPTAALDALAENAIYESFNAMVQDKTAIYISHRLASTRFCDVIAFFENGEVVEYGTHDELMALGGKYAEMFQVQAHYYREGTDAEAEEVCEVEC